MGDDIIIRLRGGGGSYSTDPWLHLERLIMWFGPEMTEISTFPGDMLNILLSGWIYMNKFQKKYDKITKNSPNMVVNMYMIGPKKDRFKPVFFGLFDFSKMKRPRSRLQKTNKQSFLVLGLFGLSPVWWQSFASPRTGLSNTSQITNSSSQLSIPHQPWGNDPDFHWHPLMPRTPLYEIPEDIKWWVDNTLLLPFLPSIPISPQVRS